MFSKERVDYLLENYSREELEKGLSAIITILELELSFSQEESEDIQEALKR